MENNNLYHSFRPSGESIRYAVWLYHRFTLSFRDVEELLASRGIEVTYESMRQWCRYFGQDYARKVDLDTIDKLCDFFDCAVGDLFERSK